MSEKILQHIYTRERRGIFTSSAGFDTVARSVGLADAFIKEEIHPNCVYGGGKSGGAITVTHFPCGRMLLGQAVPTLDFTGSRTAFFMHNYILPAEKIGGVLDDIKKLLRTRFDASYDISSGGELTSLEELPCLPSKENSAEIPEAFIIQAASRVIEAIKKSKKAYILVPPEILDKHTFACAVLAEIYKILPEAAKHLLGFCTYSREPEKRKNIHLIFLEKEAYRAGDSRFAGDFIVDFSDSEANASESIKSSEIFISEKIAALSFESFFTEINFWHTRMPQLSVSLSQAEIAWAEKNLENLTANQFFSIPQKFIQNGKSSKNPEIYVTMDILKKINTALLSGREISLRYFLGSYSLPLLEHNRIKKILRRVYENYKTSQHDENIEFLFSLRVSQSF
jgi:hypothetical protein